jgi:hypothetical protein
LESSDINEPVMKKIKLVGTWSNSVNGDTEFWE